MMNPDNQKIFPDDPRLTAYALGELEGDGHAAVEAALREDAALRAVVEDVRATAAQLAGALATEAMPAAAWEGAVPTVQEAARARRGILLRFPQAYFVVSGLAAACFMVFVLLRDPEARPVAAVTEGKVYTVSNLPAAESAVAASEPEAPESVTVAPKTVMLQVPDFSQGAATAPEASRKDTSLLGQAGNPIPPKSSASDATTSGPVPGAFSPENKIKSETESTGRVAGNGAGDRGVVLRKEVGFQKSPGGAAEAGAVGGAESPTFAVGAERVRVGGEPARTENYANRKDGDFLSAAENPLSTFSADVDTASYANVRRMLRAGRRPPADAVRIEELVNYFPYRYAAPKTEVFAAALEVAEAPWAAGHRLVRIGLKAREVAAGERGAANLVFLVDVSGSMSGPARLPLVKESLRLLVNRLRPDDRVAVVTYAGNSGLALASTPAARKREIVEAIEAMTPGGATNGGMGIQLAYDVAKANFVTGGVNRVILCTGGDFNVGVTDEGELVRLIREKAESGVFLTVLGFGMGNLQDGRLEAIADKGNGSYGYIDSRREAEKLLGAQVNGTLTTVAKDVKFQVEFNPARVASYRLIGTENRMLANPDFNNDKVDAGEVGAGHTVTALYEVVPASEAGGGRLEAGGGRPAAGGTDVDALKYMRAPARVALAEGSAELLTVKVRFKEPAGDESRKLEFTLTDRGATWAEASGDFKFAGAVAAFGMVLRDSPHKGTATLAEAATWAEAGAADDPGGWRGEFVELARAADGLR